MGYLQDARAHLKKLFEVAQAQSGLRPGGSDANGWQLEVMNPCNQSIPAVFSHDYTQQTLLVT